MSPHVFLLLLLQLTHGSAAFKLNVPRVRLPALHSTGVNFTLAVEEQGPGGCYKWTTTRPTLLTLTPPEGQDCPTTITLSTTPTTEHHSSHSIVYVEALSTGQLVRCDVIIDRIERLQIVTSTRELHLEESPSKFTVRAYGSHGNEFTTLEGVGFRWSSTAVTNFIPFTDSKYNAPPWILALEARHLQGAQVLLEGVRTGVGQVSAKLLDKGYPDLSASLEVVVIANLVLDPGEIVVERGIRFGYKLLQVKEGGRRVVEIPLPSPHYTLVASNRTTIKLEPGTVTTLEYGQASVTVHDRLELEEYPTMEVRVAKVEYLSIRVGPSGNPALVLGRDYEIGVELFDEEGRLFYIGEQLHASTRMDPEYLQIRAAAENGTHFYVTPVKTGVTLVRSRLDHKKLLDGSVFEYEEGPAAELQLTIHDPVRVEPPLVVLPCGAAGGGYEVQMRATGGDAHYKWTSSNQSLFNVQSEGLLRASNVCGTGSLHAAMAANVEIGASVEVHLSPPTALRIHEGVYEGAVGAIIRVPLSIYTLVAGQELPFTDCSRLPLRVEIDNEEFTQVDGGGPPGGPACAQLAIVGRVEGVANIRVEYRSGDVLLQGLVQVEAFRPLEVISPATLETRLALGASNTIVYRGGPTRPTAARLRIANETVAVATPVQAAEGYHAVTVTCTERGEANGSLLLESGGTLHTSPPVRIVCPQPSSIHLALGLDPRCSSGRPTPISSDEGTVLNVVVLDRRGHPLDNITTLGFEWESTPGLLTFRYSQHVPTLGEDIGGGHTVARGRSLQTLLPVGEAGKATVLIRLRGYPHGKPTLPQLTHSQEFDLVSDAVAEPAELNLFNHPSYQTVVTLSHGSGHFAITSSNPIIKWEYSNRSLLVTPLQEGEGVITVRDLCLRGGGGTGVVLPVRVTPLGSIHLTLTPKLQLGSSTTATIRIHSPDGGYLPPSDLLQLDIHLDYNRAVIQVELDREQELGDGLAYRVEAKSVGETEVGFRAAGGLITRSVARRLVVFHPLELDPLSWSLLRGAWYEWMARGGPPADGEANILFRVDNSSTASIPQPTSGLLQATLPGSAILTSESRSSTELFTSATADLQVVPASSFRIHISAKRLLVNQSTPIWVRVGKLHPDQFLGATEPLLSVEWRVSNQMATIDGDGQLRAVLTAGGTPGRVALKMTASYLREVYHDEVEVELVEETVGKTYLMAPNSELQLDPSYAYIVESQREHGCLECTKRVLEISEGLVRAAEPGFAVVLVYTKGDGGMRVGSCVVEVKSPSYILASAHHELTLPSGSYPPGLALHFRVGYHDDLGRVFDSIRPGYNLRPSRHDLLDIQHDARGARFQLAGEGVVGVRVTDGRMLDFAVVRIAPAISPQFPGPTPIGSVICLRCDVRSAKGHPGRWKSSENVKMLEDGIAVAMAPGAGLVEYFLEGHGVVDRMELRIVGGLNISFAQDSAPVTNSDPSAISRFPFSAGAQTIGGCPPELALVNSPFSCSLQEEEELFRVGVGFDIVRGHHCTLRPLPPREQDRARQLTLRVGYANLGATMRLQFQPAILLKTTELSLTNAQPQGSIKLGGAARDVAATLVVTPSSDYLKLLGVDSSEDSTTIQVKLQEWFWLGPDLQQNMSVMVWSPVTGQSLNVPVHLRLAHLRGSESGWWGAVEFVRQAWSQIMLAVLVVLFTLVFIHVAARCLYDPASGVVGGTTGGETVFLSSPTAAVEHPQRRLSYSPKQRGESSRDSGFPPSSTLQRRLFSTPPHAGDGLYTGKWSG